MKRRIIFLGALAVVQGCTCRAYVDVTYLDMPTVLVQQLVAMVGDTVPLVAQAQKYHGDGECSDGGKILGPGSASRPSDYSWASSVPSVVRPLPTGRVIAVAPGQALLTVAYTRDAAEEASVRVEIIPRIDSVTIEPLTASVAVGDTVSFRISEWAGAARLPVRFPGIIDPHLREVDSTRFLTSNMIRQDPARVLLRGDRAGTARLRVWSLTWNYARIPQDTATLAIH